MSATTPGPAARGGGVPSLVRLMLALALLLPLPLAGHAQTPGSLAGRVLSQGDLLPLPGVRVILEETGDRLTTGEDGAFHFSSVPPGAVVVRIERDGYISLVESVSIASLELTLVQFQLHRIGALLDELFVLAERGETAPRSGASEAEISGGGADARTATDLLARSVPGMSLVRGDGSTGGSVRVRLRGVSSITLSDDPSIYLDGVRIDDGGGRGGGLGSALNVLDQIPAGEVRRIRILRGPASAAGYANSAAGVILIETVRSRTPESSR